LKPIVHIGRCPDYDIRAVRQASITALEAIGGLPIKNGDTVLLKPNLLAPKAPEKAVTTHPALITAVAELARDCGAKVLIGDSPAGSPGEAIWDITGIKSLVKWLDIKKVDFTLVRALEAEVRGNQYYLALPAVNCDLLINLPKLKTHSLTMFTGAVKNLFGCLPGFQKGNWHRRAPKNEQFSQVVVDVYSKFRPKINIMDAIIAMEGDGPSNGVPKHLGLILGSNESVAMDKISAQIIGFGPDEILTTQFAEMRGISNLKEGITLSGLDWEEVKTSNFILPKDRYLRMIPHLAHELLGKMIWTRPEIETASCTLCGDCVNNCPSKAMSMDGAPPVIDYKICISCFCCDEVCPTAAVKKKMSWLARKLS
jgi:uncharacterized protein (DUF362 family)/Pyruvate/2-oxoacid:ferredoxin oxidoreductase delta subunit